MLKRQTALLLCLLSGVACGDEGRQEKPGPAEPAQASTAAADDTDPGQGDGAGRAPALPEGLSQALRAGGLESGTATRTPPPTGNALPTGAARRRPGTGWGLPMLASGRWSSRAR